MVPNVVPSISMAVILVPSLSVRLKTHEGRAIALEISYSHSDCTASAKSYSQMTPRSSDAHRDAAQQRVAGVFIPVGTWLDRVVCDGGPTDFFPASLGRRFELIDERSETRRHRLRYSVVLDPEPSPNCQQPCPSI